MKYQLSMYSKGKPSGRSEYHDYLELDLKESITSKDLPDRLNSIFDHDPFQEFTGKVYNSMLHSKESMMKLVKAREDALEKLERRDGIQMMKQRSTSPKTVNRQRIELEVWVSKEKEETKRNKSMLERNWKLTPDYVKKVYTKK